MTRFILFLFFAIHCCFNSIGQVNSSSDQWTILNNKYYSGQIKDIEYLIEIQNLLYNNIANGIYYKPDELIQKLTLYKKIAWGNKKLSKKKAHYFRLLLNNSKMQGRVGEAIYYAEKVDQIDALNGIKTINALVEKIYFFDEQSSYNKVIDAYKKEEPYIYTFPKLLLQGKRSFDDGINVIQVLNSVVHAYCSIKDSINIPGIIAISEDIFKALPSKRDNGTNLPQASLLSKFYIYSMRFNFTHEVLNDNIQSQLYLDSISRLLSVEEYQGLPDFLQIIETNLTHYKLNFYIDTKNIDSAYKYLEKYKESGTLSENQESDTNFAEGRIYANQKKFELAYNALLKTLKLKNEEHIQLANEMDEFLYAHTKAESTAAELELTKSENRKRNNIILIASIIVVLTFLLIYLKLKIKNTKIKDQISTLNNITTLRIAAMEESKSQAIVKEQERLAQDIHDDLAGSIASVKHQLEAITFDSESEVLKKKLSNTILNVEEIYSAARSKSHYLINKAQTLQNNSLIDSILVLTTSALPANKYKTDVQLDADIAQSLSFDERINILKIIQEAIINIIKHSKASEVSIYLYETSERKIVLQISDNGIGTPIKPSKPGIGLTSIKKRVKALNGYMDLYNDNGLVMNISFDKANEVADSFPVI